MALISSISEGDILGCYLVDGEAVCLKCVTQEDINGVETEPVEAELIAWWNSCDRCKNKLKPADD